MPNSAAKTILNLFLLLTILVGWTVKADGQEAPERVILLIIDGLAAEAPARIEMPIYNALKQEGVYYQAMHLILPGHPDKSDAYPWSCSLPNPMLMSGTPFIGTEGLNKQLIQHVFEPEETAFIVNAKSYLDVSGGFGTYISKPRNPDSLVIDLTIEKMKEQDFAFMRVHLQRAGIEGMKVSKEKYADQPYYRNIWHEESRYREAIEIADEQLGRFVDWLKAEDLWGDTLLMICGDHGQANEGWHEPYSPASNVTPLLIVGSGISGAETYEYCEIFDIAPTIAHLSGKEQPAFSQGRILREAFDTDVAAPKVARNVQRFNKTLIEAHEMSDEQKESLAENGFMSLKDLGRWHNTDVGSNFERLTIQQEAILESVKK